jgi:hypothetical protein
LVTAVATNCGIPSTAFYKFGNSDWALRGKNEAALRGEPRQRGSGHGYYFSAEQLLIALHWHRLGVGTTT